PKVLAGENAVVVYRPNKAELSRANAETLSHLLLELRDVLRYCGTLSPKPRLDLILPGALIPAGRDEDLGAAALAAAARSLSNEWPDLRIRVLDVDVEASMAVGAAATEIVHADQEAEIAVDETGRRWVPRTQVLHRAAQNPDGLFRLTNTQTGQLRHLAWTTVDAHELALPEDAVEVDTHAAGLNFRDVMYALGLLGDEALEAGFAGPGLGLEFVGTIRRVGTQVARWQPGDRVLGFAPQSLSSRVVTPAHAIAALPAGMDESAAASLPVAFFTAWYALHTLGRIRAGERVLIHGAAGAVGLAALQIAQLRGAEIYATAGSPAKRDLLRLLGVRHVYDSRSLAFADQIMADTAGGGLDVVLNSLAGAAMDQSLRLLKPFGRFLELGKRDFYGNTRLGLRPMRNNLRYFGIDADQLLALQPEETQSIFAECLEEFRAGNLVPLPVTRFTSAAAQDAFRYMQQSRQIGKIVIDTRGPYLPVVEDAPSALPKLALDPASVYLISGGNAGLGWHSVQRLISRGARKILILCRSGQLSEGARAFLARNNFPDLELRVEAVDVSDEQALRKVLSAVVPAWGPLGGIVHAAAVIEDALAEHWEPAQLHRVLAPKLDGARHLHVLSRQYRLEFFILLSSISNLLGNVGQGAYLAANGALESLALQRRAQGLPATVLQLGPIADAGFLTRHPETRQMLERRLGGHAIGVEQALDALEWAVRDDIPILAAADLRWSLLRQSLPWVDTPRHTLLDRFTHSHGEIHDGDGDWRNRILAMDETAARGELAQWIAEEVAQILRLHPEHIDPRKKLSELGFDSLMGMELGLALEERLGIRIPSFVLSEEPTIQALAQRLWRQLQESDDGETGSDETAAMTAMAKRHGALEAYQQASTETV
ncbi:MAG: type I polyketide synthase, partial [Acidithiobacillus sp.]|uniref:type I polyketide synthase n=1 Tax=Acidithiobacillus sp. TaxID=1872118 RepID=UPI003D05BD4B